MEEKKPFVWRKKAVSKTRKISLLSNTTKHTLDVFIFQKICWNNFFTCWRKLSCLVFTSIKQHIFQKRFNWFCVVGLPMRKEKPLWSCAVLTLEFAQLLKPSSSNWISSLKNMVFDWMKNKAVATNGAAAMQRTTNGAVRKTKNISLDRVSTCFFGGFFGHRPRLFWNNRKNVSQFGHNAIFSHTKMSQDKKWPNIFKFFWKNNRNVSAKINLGFNSLYD